jgi:hypothetical protein
MILQPWTAVTEPQVPRVGALGAVREVAQVRWLKPLSVSSCFRLRSGLSRRVVSRVVSPIVVNGIRYSVLRLDRERGNVRFLLRSESGELFGVYGRNAQEALSAAPLKLTLSVDNPFKGVDLFESDPGELVVAQQ